MNLIKGLVDKRVEIEFTKTSDSENYIFTKPFDDNIRNIVLLQTKNRDFIHKYVFENNERYVFSDVILEDGTVYKNVKFKLVVVENGETPLCTLNPSILLEDGNVEIEVLNEKKVESQEEIIEVPSEEVAVTQDVLVGDEIPDYTTLVESLNRLEKEKKVFEENRQLSNRIENQKKEIVSEILYSLFNQKNSEKAQSNTRKLVQESLKNESKALKYFFAEYIKKEAGEFKNLINEVYTEYTAKFPDIDENISRVSSKIEELMKEQKLLVEKKDKFINELKGHINTSIIQYSRRILELGGGGGTNAVQYYNGGTMYGDLIIDGDIHAVNFDSLFTTVQANSAAWSGGGGESGPAITLVRSNSALWNSNYYTVNALSANWEYAYSQIDKTSTIINYLSSQIDLNVYKNVNSNYETLYEFTANPHPLVYSGYTVTLKNKRVYILAGQDQNNPNHYIELNANPHKPIYVEAPLSGSGVIVDVIDLYDFKSAKYTLQVETNYNNEVYYSEMNVVGIIGSAQSVVSEYGQLFTVQLMDNYNSFISSHYLYLSATFMNPIGDPSKQYIIKGLRTNFYKI